MKHTLSLLTCALLVTAAHAGGGKVFNDVPRIVSCSEISYEQIEQLTKSKDWDFVIEFKEGTVVPLRFLVRNPFFSAALDPNLVFKVEKTCYLRVAHRKAYMSEDLVNWEKPEDFLGREPAVNIQLIPNADKGGFTLQATLTPQETVEEDESDEWEDD